jgi:hypothetical protein
MRHWKFGRQIGRSSKVANRPENRHLSWRKMVPACALDIPQGTLRILAP